MARKRKRQKGKGFFNKLIRGIERSAKRRNPYLQKGKGWKKRKRQKGGVMMTRIGPPPIYGNWGENNNWGRVIVN